VSRCSKQDRSKGNTSEFKSLFGQAGRPPRGKTQDSAKFERLSVARSINSQLIVGTEHQ